MYALRLAVPPAAEPVSLEEAKVHLRVEHDADDALISAQIAAAREWAEGLVGRRFVTQTWEIVLDAWPVLPYRLPLSPVRAVVSVSCVTEGGDTVEVPAEDCRLGCDGTLWLAPGRRWPDVELRRPGGVTVSAEAGYGDAGDVPRRIRQAVLLLVGHWYATREAVNVGNIVTEVPMAAQTLLWMERVVPV